MAGTDLERERVINELDQALHDMCQPLTALYCRLEIGGLNEETASIWRDCLRECERLTNSVSTMRALIRQAQANEHGRNR